MADISKIRLGNQGGTYTEYDIKDAEARQAAAGLEQDIILGGVYDVSAKNSGATFASLSALLSNANLSTLIPTAVRKGGMSIRFVTTSDNKYVQYFLPKDEWSVDTRDWEKMNLEEELNQLGQELQSEIGWINIQTDNDTYVPIKILSGKTYRVRNNGVNKAAVYFRIEQSSSGQQYVGYIEQGNYVDVEAESDFNYIYIYKTTSESYDISIADLESLQIRVSQLEETAETRERVNILESDGRAFASINSLAIGNSSSIAFAGRFTDASFWLINENSSHILFIVKSSDTITIVGNATVGAQYAFLKAYPKPVNRGNVQYCSGTSIIFVGHGVTSQTTAPSDAKFLCINTSINGTDYTPASILINGKDPFFNKNVRQYLNEITGKINSINDLLIENATVTLAGSATSKVILNESILLSEDGDYLELEVSTQAGANLALGFANSGLSANGYYSIQLGKSFIGIRAADGTWLYQSVAISTDGNIKMKILYADGKIYTYINDALKNTYNGQKNIQIASFGNGGNGTYGYWSGTIKSVNVNGTLLNLYIQDIQNAIMTPVYRFLQRSDVASIDIYPRGVLKYDHTNKVFTFYSQIGKTNKYNSFKIKLDQNDNDLVYLKEWRWFGGNLCEYDGTSFSDIANTVYDAENEMAMYFKDAIDYTGGIHGDERIDVSQDSFVNFFAGGRKITDTEMQSDFTVECPSFSYMQLSTLHETSKTQGEYVAGHPIIAYHYKRNTFENCASHLENVIKMASEQTVTQYHAGMMSVGKGSGKYAVLPGMVVTPELSGSNPPADPASHHIADDFSASRVDLWNPTTGARCYVEGFMVQGFDNETDIDQFEIWDRSTDSKYYRRYVNNTGKVFAANSFIRNIQNVVYY